MASSVILQHECERWQASISYKYRPESTEAGTAEQQGDDPCLSVLLCKMKFLLFFSVCVCGALAQANTEYDTFDDEQVSIHSWDYLSFST